MLSTHPNPPHNSLMLALILVLPDYNDVEDNGSNLANYGAYSDVDLERQPLLRAMIGESANHLLKTRRRRLGIADECCLKQCSYRELYNYCI